MSRPPADWQLPPGVNRGLWDYLHSAELARNYDDGLAGSSLFTHDLPFVERHCQPPGRLLDLGCGTGRLLLHAAARGYEAVGVDLSAEMLAVAARKAREAQVTISLIQASIVELDALTDGSFDHAACLFSTLGMVTGDSNRRRVVGHAYRLLRPGGRFVLHAHNRWFNLRDSAGRSWLLGEMWRSWTRGTPVGDRVMPVHQGVAGLTLHTFTRREAVQMLRDAGFHLVEVMPISLRADGKLPWPWWFGGLRAYGYLLVGEKA